MYPIFHTSTNVQSSDAVQLQQPIDNCNGDLYVRLKSINYVVGWYNLESQADSLVLWNTDPESTLPFSSQFVLSDTPNLWSLTVLADQINAFSDKFSIQLDRTTGKITLTVNPNFAIIFSAKLASMLSISSANVVSGSMSYYPGLTLTLMNLRPGRTYQQQLH